MEWVKRRKQLKQTKQRECRMQDQAKHLFWPRLAAAVAFALALSLLLAPVMQGGCVYAKKSSASSKAKSKLPKPSLEKKSMTLKVGQAGVLKIKNARGTVTWTVADKGKLKITKKNNTCVVFKGLKAGKTKLYARVRGYKLACTVTVKKAAAKQDQKTVEEDQDEADTKEAGGKDEPYADERDSREDEDGEASRSGEDEEDEDEDEDDGDEDEDDEDDEDGWDDEDDDWGEDDDGEWW